MNKTASTFLSESEIKAADLGHRNTINFNISKYNAAVKNGKLQFADLPTARERAKNVKWKAIENLDKHLEDFEMNFMKRGGKVIWAENAEQAREEILAICRAKNCKTVVKSKSMATEEIHLNDFLQQNNIESVETDLGEYIQQLDDEPPYHIVTPAMHKSKEQVAQLFHEKLGSDPALSPEQLTLVARDKLRQKYLDAEVGITGANFIIADIGGIAVTENEGNARLSTSFPKTHIALVGIEKVLPSINDLALFWPLLATYGTGQQITSYNTILSGPRQEGEIDGPEEMYVIFLDNGRTNILKDEVARESLYCIRCGSCLNACPVYKNIGGHTYKTTYSGPIGAVITPHLQGIEKYMHLSFASSLCGNCTEVCPVRINLHELLLHNRHKAVEEHHTSGGEKIGWYGWKQACLSRRMMNLVGGKTKNFVIGRLFGKAWGDDRALPVFAPKSFNQMWKERKK
ncbi:LutB/LldF family L-lactate oxidation iron-sulfur protein [Chitinophaga sp. XS-30]|uniref:LutB/LldF family L-lactate oxidation iron-sulfur protein n=1 Tax=Chitinophaga sp. XS-30 TaxID=2604421 RepID=UPI0011DE3C0B|nr:LutB/LldF family L-lactate oxidation iron-sulfur protein [Chitinophaga sp. XS-30]QEH40284.1 iron-sulfur cluster-binding protein [Chitinophaga sp. XS-30]